MPPDSHMSPNRLFQAGCTSRQNSELQFDGSRNANLDVIWDHMYMGSVISGCSGMSGLSGDYSMSCAPSPEPSSCYGDYDTERTYYDVAEENQGKLAPDSPQPATCGEESRWSIAREFQTHTQTRCHLHEQEHPFHLQKFFDKTDRFYRSSEQSELTKMRYCQFHADPTEPRGLTHQKTY